MARNEFKPPSDFVADDAGGSKRNVWKWLGIGCAVIVLIVGGLLAAGAWKTVSCCNEAVDSARVSMEAAQFSTEFAQEIGSGDIDQARSKMTDELRSRVSADQLEEQLAQYQPFLEASSGRVSDVSVRKTAEDPSTFWNMTVEFAPPTGRQKLVMFIKVISRGEEEERRFLVDDLKFEERTRDKSAEPAAVEVLDFHRQIRLGNYEQAYRHLSSDFAEQSDLEAFRGFIRDQNEVFRTGEVDIESVAYGGAGHAVVVAEAVGDGRERVQIDYELVRRGAGMGKWFIASVTPTYELAEPAAAIGDGPDAGSEDAASKDAASKEAGVDEETGQE
jgi:hypothetical protein